MIKRNKHVKVLGIVNTTPDSFSDGGLFLDAQRAIDHGHSLMTDGADLLDIGGESTRPGSQPVSAQKEMDRIMPVVEELVKHYPLSVDTQKTRVMQEVLRHPIVMINDVFALQDEGAMTLLSQHPNAKVVLMHQGKVGDFRENDPVNKVGAFLRERVYECEKEGICRGRMIVDPGMGFQKNAQQNLSLLPFLTQLAPSGCEVMLGISRKRMFKEWLGCDAIEDRVLPSVVMAVLAASQGIHYLRVHDVLKTRQALKCMEAFALEEELIQ